MFLRIETMYFWLRSAGSNIHEAIPQTGCEGEGNSMLQTRSIPPTSIIQQPLNASENCLNIHHSNLAGWRIQIWEQSDTERMCGIYLSF